MKKLSISIIAAVLAMNTTTAFAENAVVMTTVTSDYVETEVDVAEVDVPAEEVFDDWVEPDENAETSVGDDITYTEPEGTLSYEELAESYGITGERGNGSEQVLEKYYGKNGYPDYISYVNNTMVESLSSDYEVDTIWVYEVGLTELTEGNKQAVLEVAAENCYITFADAEYSYNERQQAYDEIREMAQGIEEIYAFMPQSSDKVIVYLRLDEVDVDITAETATVKKGNEIICTIPLYGGMVEISEEMVTDDCYDGGVIGVVPGGGEIGSTTGVGIDTTTGMLESVTVEAETKSLPVWAWAAISAVAAAIVVGAVLLIRGRAVSVNSDGSAEMTAAAKTDVEKLIAGTTEQPSKELKDKIMREIDK